MTARTPVSLRPLRHLAAHAVLISILCHLAYFSLFTFSFSQNTLRSARPSLVFLGSILRKHDFLMVGRKFRTERKERIDATPLNVTASEDLSAVLHFSTLKPAFARTAVTNSKQVFKPSLPKTEESTAKTKAGEDQGLESTVAPRIPLKLDRK